jgi:hypothetical protein
MGGVEDKVRANPCQSPVGCMSAWGTLMRTARPRTNIVLLRNIVARRGLYEGGGASALTRMMRSFLAGSPRKPPGEAVTTLTDAV